MSQIPGYVTLAEAAKEIRVSHVQVTRYVHDGLIEFVKVGNQYLIPEAAVEKFERPARGNPAFKTNKNPAIQASRKKRRKNS